MITYSRVSIGKYLNNIAEQDHRCIKKRIRSMLGLKSFCTVALTLRGIEAVYMMKKGQLVLPDKSVQNHREFIHTLFGLAS